MILSNLNWSMHQTEMAITYLGKLISDIVNRGRNPGNGIRNNPGCLVILSTNSSSYSWKITKPKTKCTLTSDTNERKWCQPQF